MKKILLTLALVLCTLGTFAQSSILWFRTTEFAWKQKEYGVWSDWSDWEDVSILVVINTATDRVNIYSSEPQEYDIYDYEDEETDYEGGTSITFHCVDANGVRCDMRIRVQADGQVQLYIDYSNIMFVYNVQSRN